MHFHLVFPTRAYFASVCRCFVAVRPDWAFSCHFFAFAWAIVSRSAIFTARLRNLVGIFTLDARFACQLVSFIIEGAFCTTYARAHGSVIIHTLGAEAAAWKSLTATCIEGKNFTTFPYYTFAWRNTWWSGTKTNDSVWFRRKQSGYQWHGNACTVLNIQTSCIL